MIARAARRAGARARPALRTAVRALRARPLLVALAVSLLVGFVAAGVNSGTLSLLPPRLHASDLSVAAAKTHVIIDEPASELSITRRAALPQDIVSLVKRAELMGQVAVTRDVLDRIAKRAGLEPGQLLGLSRLTANAPLAFTEPGSERRAADIRSTAAPYRIEVQSRPNTPVLDIYAQAHDTVEAERIADATVVTLRDYLQQLSKAQGADGEAVPQLRQLGPARGGVVGGRTPLIVAVLTFIVAFGLAFGALAYALGLRRRHRPRRATAAELDAGGNWPRTTRVLPWMLAGFMAMLWLTPFHTIELTMSTPIDMTLDRIVLPFVGGLWLLALCAGVRVAPRFRLTWVHVAVGVFVVCACLSVVLHARGLTRTLELDQSIKKLPLLITYVSLFVIATTVIRRSEVNAFLTYTLGLAAIVAFGLVIEYRFKHNYFFEIFEKTLPGMFSMGEPNNPSAVDHMGRRLVHGPAEVPLEVVTMLSLALPVALVRLLHTSQWRSRIIYGIAACAMMAAMFATFRKSGLLAPVSVVMALAYFRRRELLKLAPLGLIVIVVISALSPGALGSTVRQFTRSDALNVPTVSDRASDYDAVRPDVWSHLAFGRGWGSYNHVDYRILDSEILHRLIEMGVVGLIAYLMIPGAVLLSARATIAARDPRSAPAALVGAAAAVAFIAASTFYDVMSFPHATYIFLYVAGLAAVAIGRPDEVPGQEPAVGHRFARARAVRPPRAAHARTRELPRVVRGAR